MEAPLPGEVIPRDATDIVRSRMREFRVVVVNGPRQAGKTTLLRMLHEQTSGQFITLDDPSELTAVRSDPVSYVDTASRPLYIDEIQRAGDPLLLAVKMAVDRDPAPGAFVLSGSTRFLTVPTLSESLTGRAAIIDLWPFSRSELAGRRSSFISRVLAILGR